jgi:ribosomal protein S7
MAALHSLASDVTIAPMIVPLHGGASTIGGVVVPDESVVPMLTQESPDGVGDPVATTSLMKADGHGATGISSLPHSNEAVALDEKKNLSSVMPISGLPPSTAWGRMPLVSGASPSASSMPISHETLSTMSSSERTQRMAAIIYASAESSSASSAMAPDLMIWRSHTSPAQVKQAIEAETQRQEDLRTMYLHIMSDYTTAITAFRAVARSLVDVYNEKQKQAEELAIQQQQQHDMAADKKG